MRDLFIGVTTSPRPEPYLVRTLQSVIAASAEVRPRLVVAPTFVDPGIDWDLVRATIGAAGTVMDPLHQTTAIDKAREHGATCAYNASALHRGLEHNYDRTLRWMLANTTAPEAPYFLVLQDDVELCPRAVDRIAQTALYVGHRVNGYMSAGAVSFYTPYEAAGRHPRALWNYPPGFYGECAVLWSRACAVAFLQFDNTSNAHDLEIGRFFRNTARFRLYAHSPCLVQHVGVSSATGKSWTDGHQRTTMNYRPAHDAVKEAKPW